MFQISKQLSIITTLAVVTAFVGTANAAVISVSAPETFTTGFTRTSGAEYTISHATINNFDATQYSKIVVVFSGENHDGLEAPVTYGGVEMQEAVTTSTGSSPTGQHWAYIYYLDTPTVNGDLFFNFADGGSSANGVGGAIFGLNGAIPGVGNVSFNDAGTSTSITTTDNDSLVVAVSTNNGSPPDPVLPLIELAREDSGSSGHGSGYQQVASISTVTPTFTGGNITVAAEFLAPEPASLVLFSLGGLLIAGRQRRAS